MLRARVGLLQLAADMLRGNLDLPSPARDQSSGSFLLLKGYNDLFTCRPAKVMQVFILLFCMLDVF